MPGKGRERSRRARPSAGRIAAAAAVTLAAGSLVLSSGAAAVLQRAHPTRALAFAPWDARAKVVQAERALAGGVAASALTRAEALARDALRRNPTLVPAWRTLGVVYAAKRNGQAARAMFATSAALSRRDLPTRLWLIEEEVRRGDVVGALGHYDIALRTSPASYDVLLPVLVGASGIPQVAPALGRLLAARPEWSGNFHYRLSQAPPADAATVARTLEVASRGGPPRNPGALRELVPAFVQRGAFLPALRIAAILGDPPARVPKGVRNGGFEREEPGIAPFDWELPQASGFGAELRGDLGTGTQALVVFASSEAAGDAARQLLVLGPGRHRLRFRAGPTAAPAPRGLAWRVACADGAPLLDRPVDVARATRGAQAEFTVPAGCPAQWLTLAVSSDAPDVAEAWVDDVSVAPVR